MQHESSDYRMMASICLEIANGMSLESDRLRLTGCAQKWIELAQENDARDHTEASPAPRA